MDNNVIWLKRLWAHLYVPKELHCYEPIGISYPNPKDPPVFHTKVCRYFDNGKCKLIGPLDDMDELLIWDKVKICGIKEDIKSLERQIGKEEKMQTRMDDTRH